MARRKGLELGGGIGDLEGGTGLCESSVLQYILLGEAVCISGMSKKEGVNCCGKSDDVDLSGRKRH